MHSSTTITTAINSKARQQSGRRIADPDCSPMSATRIRPKPWTKTASILCYRPMFAFLSPPIAPRCIGNSPSTRRRRSCPTCRRLGMGDFYASPIFEARPGSMHGYDVTRHDRLNPELGGAERFAPFAETLRGPRHGPAAGHCAQPHGHRQRLRVVAGRARERPCLPLRQLLRHRLEPAEGGDARQAAAADSGQPVRRRAGGEAHPGGA